MTRSVLLVLCLVLAGGTAFPQKRPVPPEQDRYRSAADYSRGMRGLSLLVIREGKTVFEEYQNGFSASDEQMLASGTKSFAGVLLAAAIEDRLVSGFDERVSETITEWRTDPRKASITLRQLLSLTGGLDSGSIGRPPTYAEAVRAEAKFDPGARFEYGPIPFQVFGEVLRRKLVPREEGVLDYLKRRILDPIGLKVTSWTLQDGQPNLPSGAFLTAREWAKFGRFLIDRGRFNGKQLVSPKLLDELVAGSAANPNYGITFWLNRSNDGRAMLAEKPRNRLQEFLDITPETDEISRNGFGKKLPKDLFAAAGAGKQRLYVVPSLKLVIVRQGRQSRFDDNEFLMRLIHGKN